MTGRRAERLAWATLGLAALWLVLGLTMSHSARNAGYREVRERLGEPMRHARPSLAILPRESGLEQRATDHYAGRVFLPPDAVDRAMVRQPPDRPPAAGREIRPEPPPDRPRRASG